MEGTNGNAAGMSCASFPPRLLLPEGSCALDIVEDGAHDVGTGSSPSSSSSSSSSPSSSDGHSSLSSSSPSLSSQSSPQSTSASPTSPPNAASMTCLPAASPNAARSPPSADASSSVFSPPPQTAQPVTGAIPNSDLVNAYPAGPQTHNSSAAPPSLPSPLPSPLSSQSSSRGPPTDKIAGEAAPFAGLSAALQKKTHSDESSRSKRTGLKTKASAATERTEKPSELPESGEKKKENKSSPAHLRTERISRHSKASSALPSPVNTSSDSASVPALDGAELTTFSERLDGGHARLCDSLAAELAQHIEMIVEDTPCLLEALNASLASSISGSGATPLSASCPPSAVPLELEIEGRLGVLIDLDTSSRLRLPVTSLALLSSSFCSRRLDGDPGEAQSAGLRFDAGVSQQQFSSVRDFMSAVCGKKGSGPGVTDIRTVHIQGNGRQENQEDANVSTREGRPSRGQLFSSVGSETEGSILDDWVSLVDSDEFFGDEEVSLSDCPSRMKELAQGREKEETISASRKTKKTEDVLENPDTWIPLPIQMTEEEYHQFPALLGDTSIRVSYPCQSSNAGLRVPTGAIWKENHMTWNLYSGKDNDQEWAEGDSKRAADLDIDEGASRRRKVDCRVAVNIEHHPNLKEIMKELDRKSKQTACPGQNQQAPVISRMRKRQSFIHPCGVRVDLTEVLVKIGGNRAPGRSGREKMLYEIEVELNPTLVLQAVKYKQMTGDSLPLLALCVSFLAVLEDLSVHLNVAFSASDTALGAKGAGESSGSRRGAASGKLSEERFADLTRSFPPSACVARYREYLSPCLPLVGDYGFRAVAPELERRDDKKLRDYLAKINVDEESLYTNDTVTIMGPWVPCLNEEGRIEFAVPVAARPRAGA